MEAELLSLALAAKEMREGLKMRRLHKFFNSYIFDPQKSLEPSKLGQTSVPDDASIFRHKNVFFSI